jgi:protein TonB
MITILVIGIALLLGIGLIVYITFSNLNLDSEKHCDLVIEGKNKDYGAYYIRRTTSKRHITALIVIFFVAAFIAALPTIISEVVAATKAISGGITEKTVIAELEDIKDDIDDFVKPEALPPPPLMASIKFTPPEITASDQMTDEDAMKSQEELQVSKEVISIADVTGVEGGTVDIRDLEVAKEIVQEETVIEKFVEQMPEFPGGPQELNAYIKKRLVFPQLAAENGIQGTTLVQFAVMKDGSVDRVSVAVSSHPLLDKEAVRVVKTLPKWIPGKIGGKAVNCYYSIPIVFTLQ